MSGQEHRRNVVLIEITAHKLRVFNGDTETKSLYVVNIGDIFQQRRDDQIGTPLRHRAAEGINLCQLALIIAAGTPFQSIQVHRICDTKILERTQEFTVNGFRQADFRCDTVAKIGEYALAIHPLRGGGQS